MLAVSTLSECCSQWPRLVSTLIACLVVSYILFRTLTNDPEQPIDYSVSIPKQCEKGWRGESSDDPSTRVRGSNVVQCHCPANGALLGLVNPSTPDGIDRAINKAKAAQDDWNKTTFTQRRRLLRTILRYVLENQETISRVACLDSGKTKVDALLGEILVTVEKLQWTIKHGEKALRSEKRPTNFLMMYKDNEVIWEPLGIVTACVSWNYPFHNFIGPVISSLFSGNAIVVKASEQTAWSLSYFASIVRNALIACGHSPNLVQPIICWPEVAPHLVSHSEISHVTFIGSRPVAHEVCKAAATSLTPVCVELGGKDPAIILDDAKDLTRIASILMRGVFQSAGQNCIGIERIIALPTVYESLVATLESRVGSLRVGSALDSSFPIDVGAMISSASFDRLEALIADAVKRGARCLVGGKRHHHPEYPKGHYFQPTLLVDVTPSMRIAQEEVFAPICVLMRATSVSDAVAIANSTPYALGASVFGSRKSDLDAVVHGVRAGMVAVNDFAVYYAVQLPFGGTKGSGYGRFAGEEGLRSLCNQKAVCRDAWWAPRTSIPGRLDYPIRDEEKAWGFGVGIVGLGYEQGKRWWRALGTLLRNM